MASAPTLGPASSRSADDRRTLPRLGLVAAVVAALLLGPFLGTAQAAPGYRYWNYFHVSGDGYAFATTGPSGFVPDDGSVEAYRYGLSTGASGLEPRTAASTYGVGDLCADQQAGSGEKRVGVLLDYGTEADAPDGVTPPEPRAACAVVPTAATGQQVLDAVSDLRVEDQLVCGIDGYPAAGCSVTVKNPPAADAAGTVEFIVPAAATPGADEAGAPTSNQADDQQAADSQEDGFSWALAGAAVLVVVLAGGALVLSRRRRAS
ncbi:MAG: SCO2322 family protein [Nocardioidaceae bacterium]